MALLNEIAAASILQNAAALLQPNFAWTTLEAVANVHAPSETVPCTRARVIQQLLEKFGSPGFRFESNFARTGNALLTCGAGAPHIVLVAHADEFSYLVGAQTGSQTWSLVPYCSHRTQIDYAAVALRYQLETRELATVAEGVMRRPQPDEEPLPHFVAGSGTVQPGDRIVLHHPLTRAGDTVQGSLDNAAAVAACLLAAFVLGQHAPALPLAFAFTDEEEGNPELNASFSRGARRLVRRMDPPELFVNVDGHEPNASAAIGGGALYAEQASKCRGAIVPPHIYAAFQALSKEMLTQGIAIHPNRGMVSRSDDVALVDSTPEVLLLGLPVSNAHFNRGLPTGSLSDIVNLAQVIVWTALRFTT